MEAAISYVGKTGILAGDTERFGLQYVEAIAKEGNQFYYWRLEKADTYWVGFNKYDMKIIRKQLQ